MWRGLQTWQGDRLLSCYQGTMTFKSGWTGTQTMEQHSNNQTIHKPSSIQWTFQYPKYLVNIFCLRICDLLCLNIWPTRLQAPREQHPNYLDIWPTRLQAPREQHPNYLAEHETFSSRRIFLKLLQTRRHNWFLTLKCDLHLEIWDIKIPRCINLHADN